MIRGTEVLADVDQMMARQKLGKFIVCISLCTLSDISLRDVNMRFSASVIRNISNFFFRNLYS